MGWLKIQKIEYLENRTTIQNDVALRACMPCTKSAQKCSTEHVNNSPNVYSEHCSIWHSQNLIVLCVIYKC